ncbi:hypothetical protein AAG906_021878 [Vitis piasezkii]
MEEEPGMSGPKQRRKVTGDEDEAFPRHTVPAKEGAAKVGHAPSHADTWDSGQEKWCVDRFWLDALRKVANLLFALDDVVGLEEEVFMRLPPGFCKEEEETKVCKLKKSLYGLKQSPRAWMTILIMYVNDIILTGDDTREVERLKKVLATEFKVKDLGQMWYFLGMEVARSRKGISISQRKYVLDLLTEIGMLGCKPSDSPIKASKMTESDGKPVDRERYQRLVGRLIYLSHTRPDIAFAVSVASQYMHSLKESHLEAVYKILRYLKGFPGRGLFFKKSDSKKVEIYTDAD